VKVRVADAETVKGTIAKLWQGVWTKRTDLPQMPEWMRAMSGFYRKKMNWAENTERMEGELTMQELEWALKNSANGKQASDIPIEMLKKAPEQVKHRLLKALNHTYRTGEIPENWKTAVVSLLYKSGDVANPLNYRPITLAPATYKLIMKILTKRASTLLEEREAFSESLGNREGKMTIDKAMALKSYIESTNNPIEEGQMHVVFVDIKKCFDSIEHQVIHHALQTMGFPVRFTNFVMNAYKFNGAEIRTAYGNTERFDLTRGVKQGCPMSPLLLNIIMDPVVRYAKGDERNVMILAWVDDLAIAAHKRYVLREVVTKAVTALATLGLELSIDSEGKSKTAYMSTRTDDDCLNICVKGGDLRIPALKESESYKYLGFHFTKTLSWSKHYNEVTRKVAGTTKYLKDRCFTARQTIDIINLMLMPAIRYKCSIHPPGIDNVVKWKYLIEGLLGQRAD